MQLVETFVGEYRSTNIGNTVTYLPWATINPSGTSSAKYVALNSEDMNYYDLSSRKFCVSCTLTTTTLFILRGICQDIGKVNHCILSVFLCADIFYVAVLGSHKWTFFNDACSKGNYTTRLVMTGCYDDEFTGNDGSCVGMSVRCDGNMDCNDATDEDECKALVTSLGYNKLLVPPPALHGERLAMKLSIDLIETININGTEKTFQTKIEVKKT